MKFLNKILISALLLGSLQGCKEFTKDLFGFDDQVPVEDLVAYNVTVKDSDVVKEQTAWSIRADVKLNTEKSAQYDASWGIIDAPSGFDMPLTFTPANDEGQTFLDFVTPNVDYDTYVTLQFTVSFNNGEELEVIKNDLELLIKANEQVVISGAVVDEPIPNATVVASIGHLEYQTTADSAGNYEFEVEFPDTTSVLELTSRGKDNYASVLFKSYLGDANTIKRQAGADNILDSSENNNATVSNVTTAQYVIIQDVLGPDDTIQSQEQLEQISEGIDSSKVLEIAAIIKSVVDEPNNTLPDGIDNVLELVQDKEAKDNYVSELLDADPEAINKLISEIVADPVLTPVDNRFSFQDKFFISKLGDYQYLTSDIFDIKDDNTGLWATYRGTFDITWELVENVLNVEFENDAFIQTFCEEGGSPCYHSYFDSATVKKLPGQGIGSQLYFEFKYKNINVDDPNDVQYTTASESYNGLTEDDVIAFTNAEITEPEMWAIRVLDESLDNSNATIAEIPFETVYATFNDDGTGWYNQVFENQSGSVETKVNFNWAVELGFLKIEVKKADNPNNPNVTDHQLTYGKSYNRMGVLQTSLLIEAPEFDKVNPKMKRDSEGDLTPVALNATMAPLNPEIDVATLELEGRFNLLASAGEESTFFLEFGDDNLGYQQSNSGDNIFEVPFGWEKTELGMTAKYYFAEQTNENLTSCEGVEDCYMNRERRIEVLNVTGDIYTVRSLQIFYYRDGDNINKGLHTSYIGLFEREDIVTETAN